MPIRISIPKSAFSANIPIDQGWQKFKLGKPYVKTAKSGTSVNYYVPCTLIGDPGERTIEHMFNSIGIPKGYMNDFIAALSGKTIKEVGEAIASDTLEFDFEAIEGKEVLGKVVHEEYEGRIQNRIKGFANPDKVPF